MHLGLSRSGHKASTSHGKVILRISSAIRPHFNLLFKADANAYKSRNSCSTCLEFEIAPRLRSHCAIKDGIATKYRLSDHNVLQIVVACAVGDITIEDMTICQLPIVKGGGWRQKLESYGMPVRLWAGDVVVIGKRKLDGGNTQIISSPRMLDCGCPNERVVLPFLGSDRPIRV